MAARKTAPVIEDGDQVKTMTDSEIRESLNDTVRTLRMQLDEMRAAFEGVQKQKGMLEDQLRRIKNEASAQLQFCKDTVAQAYKSLYYMKDMEA